MKLTKATLKKIIKEEIIKIIENVPNPEFRAKVRAGDEGRKNIAHDAEKQHRLKAEIAANYRYVGDLEDTIAYIWSSYGEDQNVSKEDINKIRELEAKVVEVEERIYKLEGHA